MSKDKPTPETWVEKAKKRHVRLSLEDIKKAFAEKESVTKENKEGQIAK